MIRKLFIFACMMFFSFSAFALPDSPNPQDWDNRAKSDLEDARLVLQNTSHYDQVCFLSHQAVEKSLKGALIGRGVQPDKSHDTAQLAARLNKLGYHLKQFHNQLQELDRLYVPSRYPKVGNSFSQEKAVQNLELAETIYKQVSQTEHKLPVNKS